MGGIIENLFGMGQNSSPEPASAPAPSPAAPAHDYGELWGTYSGWKSKEDSWFSKESSRVKADMASKGIRSNTQGWKDRLQSVQSAYEERIANVNNTETARVLRENWQGSGAGGDNMISWYSEQYGKPQITKSGEGDSTGTGPAKASARRAPLITDNWLSGTPGDDLWLTS